MYIYSNWVFCQKKQRFLNFVIGSKVKWYYFSRKLQPANVVCTPFRLGSNIFPISFSVRRIFPAPSSLKNVNCNNIYIIGFFFFTIPIRICRFEPHIEYCTMEVGVQIGIWIGASLPKTRFFAIWGHKCTPFSELSGRAWKSMVPFGA